MTNSSKHQRPGVCLIFPHTSFVKPRQTLANGPSRGCAATKQKSWCDQAEAIAEASLQRFPLLADWTPETDVVYLRSLLLGCSGGLGILDRRDDGDPVALGDRVAEAALRHDRRCVA